MQGCRPRGRSCVFKRDRATRLSGDSPKTREAPSRRRQPLLTMSAAQLTLTPLASAASAVQTGNENAFLPLNSGRGGEETRGVVSLLEPVAHVNFLQSKFNSIDALNEVYVCEIVADWLA